MKLQSQMTMIGGIFWKYPGLAETARKAAELTGSVARGDNYNKFPYTEPLTCLKAR
jgi:hypothetical protein